MDIDMPKTVDEVSDQLVACVVQGTFVFFEIRRGETVPDDHVGFLVEHRLDQRFGGVSGIGAIPIHHEVTVGIDLSEHPTHHIALALSWLFPHLGTCGSGNTSSLIRGVVVIHIDYRLRQHFPEVGHHRPDGLGFVVTRNQHGDAWLLVRRGHRANRS